MFDLFSDPVKVAQQLEILQQEGGFAVWETLYSLLLEVVFAYIIGLPLGVLLVTGEKEGIHPLPGWLMKVLGWIINVLRSVPFLILMIISLPLSKIIVGTKVGTAATIPPMVIAAFPLIARMVESSLREVDHGVIEAAQSMGATTWQIVTRVMLPEAVPSLISGGTISVTTILGYGAMAGIIGGGGLGKMAINYGYYNFKFLVMWVAVIGLVLLVQIFQSAGGHLATRLDKRLRGRK
ncbi:MAG: ABC transporter permease [Clostridiales bacterium]|jgi:D-methionine transport system permease protein|nr:ABC transporter permease [Clostridiales bacterium]